jgi:hypothetical protein
MRTITFRRFMYEVETLIEPVQLILTKRETGEVLTLGEFYPRGQRRETPFEADLRKDLADPAFRREYESARAELSPKKDPPAQQAFRPVPKPGSKK